MKKVEVQLEYISFFKDEVKLKFTFSDIVKKEQVGKLSYDYKNATDYIKIKEVFESYVKEKDFSVIPDVNVVLSTNQVYNTSLILPKAAAKQVNKFVDNDLLDKFGVDYKKKYRSSSIVSKYKDGGLCVCTSLISNDLVQTLTDILTTLHCRIKNISSINFLLHEKAKLGKGETNKIVLYVKDNYTAINVYYAGALVERSVSYHSYKYLTSMNIVQRRKLIRELVLSIVTLIGKIDYTDVDVEFTNVDLYVKDEVLASQFKYENPLKFNYNVITKSDFRLDLFKKYNFVQKPVLVKGFTLAEVVVSVGVFALCATSLIAIAATLSVTSQADANRTQAYNVVENIAEHVQNDPANAPLIKWNGGQSSIDYNGKFEALTGDHSEDDVYATLIYTATSAEVKNDHIETGKTSYKVDISSFTKKGTTDSLISSLTIRSVK